MNLQVSASRRALLPGKFSLEAIKIVLPLAFVVLGTGCATHEKLTAEPPLWQAERRLVRAEKAKLNLEGKAAEYLAVAKIGAGEIGNDRTVTPDSTQARMLYNRAVVDLATDLPTLLRQKNKSGTLALRDEQTGETWKLQVDSGKPGEYRPTSYDKILKAASVNRKGLEEDVTRNGVGGTVIGVQQSLQTPRLEPLKGYRVPVTAVVDFPGSSGASNARLRFLDPNTVSYVNLEHNRYALAADFSAAIASYGRVNENWIGLMNMVRGERMRGGSGLLMMQTYDPARIPVIFVHGLLSSTYIWRNVINSLMAEPEIRRRCQFWAFSYSTGNPIAYSALLLRDDLLYAQKRYRFSQVVLIGHSMGGILSRIQVTNSGKDIWNALLGTNADRLYAEVPEDSLLKRSLIFAANPTVKRVIFVATPHRGSTLASGGIGLLGMRLIRLPLKVASAIPRSVVVAFAPHNDPKKYRVPTSISGLSPTNPLFKALDKLAIEAPHNSIIGDRGRGDTPRSSDGVVPYWSSHLDSAQSELIVPTDHGAMKSPKTVAELRRILLLQIGSGSRPRSGIQEHVVSR